MRNRFGRREKREGYNLNGRYIFVLVVILGTTAEVFATSTCSAVWQSCSSAPAPTMKKRRKAAAPPPWCFAAAVA